MGATFNRIKNWTTEVLSDSDINAEFNNILTNLTPSGMDDYSSNNSAMRTQTNPGGVGSESLATSLAGEIERLRYVIARLMGETYWYSAPGTTLADLNAATGGGFSSNRISSGASSSTSSQLRAIIPSGTTTSLTLNGSPTPFVYYVNDVQYSITADSVVTGLSSAPSSNNTAAINDAQAGDAQFTEFLGEYGTQINIGTAGSEFASRVGQYAGFALNNGGATEYFVGYIESTAAITRAMRGCFIDSSANAVPRVRYTNGDSITLLRLGWIFANTSAGIAVTYTTPVYSPTEPSAPSTGDYWFDLANDTWKTYNSVAWIAANATLIGMTLQTSAACVAARTFDQFTALSETNSIELEWASNTTVRAKGPYSTINVFGSGLNYGIRRPEWDMTSHLESGLNESASTFYYFYLTETGAPKISDKVPLDLRGSRLGLYHPQETWRCIGCAFNDASSNLLSPTVYSFFNKGERLRTSPTQATGYRLTASVNASAMTVQVRDQIGNYPSQLIPTYIPFYGATASVGSYSNIILNTMPEIIVGSASTLGHGNSRSCPIFVYLLNSGSSYDLAVTSGNKYGLAGLYTTLAIGSTGTADSGTAMYTTAALTSMPGVLLGHMVAPQTSAGLWTSAPTTISVGAVMPEPNYVTASVTDDTPAGDTQWLNSGCSFTLDPGEWELFGSSRWTSTANVNTIARLMFAAADGGDSGSTPADITTLTGVTVVAGFNDYKEFAYNANVLQDCHDIHLVIRTTQTNTFYLVAYSDNSGNGLQLDLRVFARRLKT